MDPSVPLSDGTVDVAAFNDGRYSATLRIDGDVQPGALVASVTVSGLDGFSSTPVIFVDALYREGGVPEGRRRVAALLDALLAGELEFPLRVFLEAVRERYGRSG